MARECASSRTQGTLLQEDIGDARLATTVLGRSCLGADAGPRKVAATPLREGCRRTIKLRVLRFTVAE
jgi:hypothetical protein